MIYWNGKYYICMYSYIDSKNVTQFKGLSADEISILQINLIKPIINYNYHKTTFNYEYINEPNFIHEYSSKFKLLYGKYFV